MPKVARSSLVVCFFLALYGVIYASACVVANKRTVQEADFWKAAGCDELCLQTAPRGLDFSDLFGPP